MRTAVFAVLGDDSFAYRLTFLLHIAAAIVGFGSTFVYPIMGMQAQKRRGIEAVALSDTALEAGKKITNPAIYLVFLFGIGMVFMADGFDFDQTWVWLSILLYVVALGISHGLHQPNLKRMNALTHELANMGPPPAGATGGPPPQAVEMEERGKRVPMYTGALDLLLLAILVLMIWKPGL